MDILIRKFRSWCCLDVTVGFSAVSYLTTETEDHVSICVDVLNPAAEGALRPFTVGLLPEPGVCY